MIAQLRQSLRTLEKPHLAVLPTGVPEIDDTLGGGLTRGVLHEIAAAGEAHAGPAAGFAIGLSLLRHGARATNSSSPLPWGEVGARSAPGEGLRTTESHLPPHPISLCSVDLSPQGREKNIVWIAGDMALAESGAAYGPGLDAFGLTPERLLTVTAAHQRDLLWAMEEALRCRAVRAVIGELRHEAIDMVTVRRLSLAAGHSGALALLLRASPPRDASTAATRWIVGAAPHDAFAVALTRNRRGALGAWTLQWSDDDECFVPATLAQPVATPAADRPDRKIA